MELNGKCIAVLKEETYQSSRTGNAYVKNGFVIEVPNGQYEPIKVKFTVMDAEKWQRMSVKVGDTYNVSFDVKSREWNGKWFTDCIAWKVILVVDGGTNTQPQQAPRENVTAQQHLPQPQPWQQTAPTNAENPDNLPF